MRASTIALAGIATVLGLVACSRSGGNPEEPLITHLLPADARRSTASGLGSEPSKAEALCAQVPFSRPLAAKFLTVDFHGGHTADGHTYVCWWTYTIPDWSLLDELDYGEDDRAQESPWIVDYEVSGTGIRTLRPRAGSVPVIHFSSASQKLVVHRLTAGTETPYRWRVVYQETELPP